MNVGGAPLLERKHNSHTYFTMASKEVTRIRRFVSGQLRDCQDLSTLTVGILKGRYLACVGRESLTQEEKLLFKRVVEEELMMMQVSDDEPRQKKRKREEAKEEEETQENGGETEVDGFRGKRPRRQSTDNSPERLGSEEVVENDCETGSEEEEKSAKKQGHETKKTKTSQVNSDSEENEKQVKGKSLGGKENVDVKNKQTPGVRKDRKRRQSKSEEKRGKPSKSEVGKDPMQVVSINSKSAGENKTVEQKRVKRKQTTESDSSSESEKSVKKNGSAESSEASDEEEEEKGKEENNVKKNSSAECSEASDEEEIDKKDESAPDSDPSSLPSLDDEQESEKAQSRQVKKTMKKSRRKRKNSEDSEDSEPASKGGTEKEAKEKEAKAKEAKVAKVAKAKEAKEAKAAKAVSRLKRYIALCGVKRNYKTLLGGCRSSRSTVAVLKKELEELGVEGQPSIAKCKNARLKREETHLDVSNIITTQGRPKRRGTSAWQQPPSPLPSYKRTVASSSDSEDSHTGHRRKRATDWSNLQGVISDDGDSD